MGHTAGPGQPVLQLADLQGLDFFHMLTFSFYLMTPVHYVGADSNRRLASPLKGLMDPLARLTIIDSPTRCSVGRTGSASVGNLILMLLMPLGEGSTLGGRYRLLSQIGRGGMGVVWHAYDDLLDRDVAAKAVLLPSDFTPAEYDEVYQQTLQEARLAARLSHPAIVNIHDVVEEESRPWIVMELIQVPSLRERIDEHGPLEPLVAAQIGLQIANALQIAHEAGILHRDVKPGNVLVDESRSMRAVLTDFGLARAHSDVTTIKTGVLAGSAAYMAPERVDGQPAIAASDLWALGAMLYEAVEGKPPFKRPETVASLVAVLNDDPAPSKNAGPLLPVINGLLRKNPDKRPTAVETAAMLERIIDDPADGPSELLELFEPSTPVTAKPSQKSARPRPTLRSMLLAAIAVAVMADLIIFTVVR
jgi:serine/threonine protein kinase